MIKTAKCLNVIRSQKRCSSGEMMWPIASDEVLVKVSVLHDGQLIASSALSNPQFTHFFITLKAANAKFSDRCWQCTPAEADDVILTSEP